MARSSVWRRAVTRLRLNPESGSPAGVARESGFFDDYPRFYSSSVTGARPERLNPRYRALIDANLACIRDRTVLDLASHDGRWTFAALKSGARYAIGIEGRASLVESAHSTFREYGINGDRYRFVLGDVLEKLDSLPPESAQTVFCFGFFYHTPHHILLLSKIARFNPQQLILDTAVDGSTSEPVIRLTAENILREANAPFPTPGDPTRAVVGVPSRSALELMLGSFGWRFRYYDWHHAGIINWHGLSDYYTGRRVTLVATRA